MAKFFAAVLHAMGAYVLLGNLLWGNFCDLSQTTKSHQSKLTFYTINVHNLLVALYHYHSFWPFFSFIIYYNNEYSSNYFYQCNFFRCDVTSFTMSNRPVASIYASIQLDAATVTVTITSTVHATPSQSMTLIVSSSSTATIGNTLSSSPKTGQCSNEQAAKDNDNSCNAVVICFPVALVIGLIVCVVTIVVVWRLQPAAIHRWQRIQWFVWVSNSVCVCTLK